MPPQFQDDEIDSFMRKRTATTPKPSPAPKPAPVADDDVDGFMSRRTGSVPTLTTKKEQKAQRREQLRQSITSLQDELVARTPQPQVPKFQSPIDMRLNAPNEAQKAFDRAAAATGQQPAAPKPRNAFQTPARKPMLERAMAQQAIERQQPQTVEADPQRLEQLKQTTAQQLAEQRDVRVRQSRANVEQMSPLQRMAVRGLAKAGGATNEDIRAIAPPQGLEADLMRATNAGVRQVGSMVRGAGEALPGFLPPAVGALRKPIRQGTVGAAKNIQGGMEAVVDAAAPDDPADQSFRAKLGRGVGSVGASMGGALATGGGSLAAGTLGALGNLGQVAEERERSGVPVSGLREAGSDALAVATGMTEALGAGRLLNRLGMKTPVIQRVAQALEEGGQEYAQGYLNDINAKLVAAYDPNRAIDDPLSRKRLEEALIGTILGSAGEVADVSAQRAMAAQQNAQQRATRSAIDQRSAANAAAIAPQPAAAQPVTEPLTEPMAAQPQPSAPRTAPIQPQPTQPEGLPRLPARELSAQDKFAQAYGAKEPVENRINTMIGKAETLLGSQNENDRKMGERMMNRALTAIRQTEGYLAEAALPPDAPRPFTTVRDAIEARLKPAPKAPKGLNPEVQKSVDLAKQDAAEAEQAGNYEAAANHWKAAHSSLVAAQREIRRSGNAEQIKAIATDISIADANRRKAMQAARTAQRQANAPTADLVKTRNNIPEKYQTSQPVDSAPLLRPDAVQNPEGGIPQMPEPTFTDRLEAAARRDASARGKAKPAKRLLSRIAELGGISDRYAGELQDVKDARRIGVIRQKAEMSPDVLARQLQSEGYDVDPEDLNTLWEAARRDIAGRDERTSQTSELERRLAEEEAAYNERQPFDQIVADVDAEPTNRLREAEYEGGEMQRYSKPLEGQAVEREAFQPDTADLREVREFGKRPPQTEQFTEEPPTAPLARRREPIRPPAPASPRQVGNRPLSVDVAGTRTPTAMSPEFPRARREMVKQGREVDALLKAKQEKGEFGNVAEAMFKSNTPDVLHGQDSFFHDPDLKGKLGLTREAEMADVRRELKTQLARSLGLSADEVSLSHIKPEVWRAWAKQKGLGREAVRKLEAGIARAERKQRATETNAAIVAEESQRAKEELRKPAAKAGKSIDAQVKQALDESGLTAQEKKAIFDEVGQPLLTYFPEDALASVNEQIASIYEQRAIRKKMQEDAAKRKATPAWQMTQAEFLATAPYLHGTNKKNAESIKAAGRIATGQPKNYSDPEFGDAVYFAKPDSHFHTKDFSEGNFDLSQKIPVEIKPDAKVLTWRSVEDIEATAKKIGYSSATQLVRDLQSDFETRSRDKAYVPDANTLKSVRAKNALRKAGYDVVEVDNPDSLTGSIEWRPDPRYAAMSLSGQQLVALNPNAVQLSSKMHEQSVRKALAEGKPVPAEVLADYPRLAPKQKQPAAPAKSIDAQIKDIRDLVGWTIDEAEAKRQIAALRARQPKIAEQRSMGGFYSQLQYVIDQKMPAKASAAQVRAIIENPQSGVKPDEVKWTGLDDYLRGKETVTKAEVTDFLKANQVEVREVESGKKAYAQYTLPGAKKNSYRELLLTLPRKGPEVRRLGMGEWTIDGRPATREEALAVPVDRGYQSSHFDEPNILAHLRFNERTDTDGKRVMHVEEIQSDWHQEGRKKGYKGLSAEELAEKQRIDAKDSALTPAEIDWYNRVVNDRQDYGVPDAPFKKNWHELAFKRALRWAAENGYERMTWTTGEQQADRFDLSKYVENISWQKNADGTYNILPTTKDRGVPGLMHQHASLSAVEDLLGKEIAAKIERGDGLEWEGSGVKQGTLQGVDLKVGGEGMKGFYDQILPAFANKYGRKWGVKVGTAKVQTGNPVYEYIPDASGEDFTANDKTPYETVHSIDITPAMKESVMKGQPLFRRDAAPVSPMPERYTGRQLFENARVQYRPARNRPGVLAMNDWGGAMLNRLLDEKFNVTTTDANFTIGASDAQELRDYLAEAKDSGIYDPAQVANMDAILQQMDTAIADANANEQDIAFVTRRPAEAISATKAKIRHEAAHVSQSRIAADLSALTGKNWLDSQPNAKDIHKELDRRGYKPETHDYEAAAFVASGDYGVFGMDVNQAAKFLSDYFGAVVEKHGKRALQKFGAIDPKLQPTLEAARRETETRRTENQQRSFEAARGNERRIGAAGEAGGSRTSVRARRREGDTGTAEGADRSPRTRASVEGSPEFKRWFGDSKVVDESGKPLVVYHGTESDFDVFDEDKIRRPGYGFGFHFAESSGLAGAYSKQGYGANKNVMPVYLSIKNPFTGDYYQFAAEIGTSWPPEIAAELKKRGYDGIRYNHGEWSESKGQSPYAWVAFSPNQIKSAIGNRGTFDPASPRIIERREGTARGGFSFGRVPEGRGQVLASFPANIQNWLGQSKPKEADMPTKPEPVPAEWNQQKWARKAADALVTRDMPKEDREKFYDINTKKPERLALLQKYMPSEQDIDALTAVIDRANNAIKNNDGDNLREAVWAARAIVERPATNAEKASALMRAAMFSTPRGRLRDLISNFAEQKLATVARIPGSAADAAFTTLRRMLTGEGERTFLGPRPGEYLRHRAADRAKQWKQTKDAWKGKHVDALEDVLQHREVNFDNKFLDKTTKAVFRAMGAADQWFFVKEYQRAIREQAELAARADVRSGVIAKADRQKQTDYYAAAPTTEMKAMAELAAKQMVFRNPNFLSDKVFKPLRENLPPGANFALDIVMPVDRTPTNIILTALEYSPLGAVKLAGQMATGTVKATAKTLRNRKDLPTRQAIKKALDEAFPPEKQRAMSRLFGRTVTGTAAPVALGFALASAGLATGFYDEDDPGEEAERREEGKMPNSVKIGDRWYELSGIAPLGMLIGLGATLHREMHAETLDPEKRYARLAKGFGNMAMELPALESAKQTVKIAKAVTGKPSDLGRIAGNIGARFVPGLVSDIGQATPYLRDPYEREVKAPKSGEKDTASLATKAGREFAGEFGARIPGVRRLLPPKMNTLTGKPVETEWSDVIDPFRSRKAVEPGSLSGVKAAQMKFDISSEVRPKIGEPDEVFQQRKQRVEGWMQEYGDKLLSHPSYSLLTQAQQQAAMESLRRRIGAQQNAAQPKLGTLAPEKVIQSVLKSEATRPKRDAGKLWVSPATRP